MPLTLDTNILVRLATRDDPVQAEAALRVIRAADRLVIPLPVWCELAWVLLRGYRYSAEQVAHAIGTLMDVDRVVCDREAVRAGLAMLAADGDFADGAIACAGVQMGADAMLTFDRTAAAQLPSVLGLKAVVPPGEET
ncbi:PIN domain protein [Tepidimonas alkaliphilus]|uniref:Ribonuclease VapC n=1 Tax=Tepidimonas alkaliphilus TaxID=2588942 RepID=A0A554W9C3_9BURK|nr:type II toxin-antitoxin system VapC family toxin [Tepidimonas alkaliphilus]TSE20169.1 PIN domain protein [Tepidimonas alkaliphilus]